MYGPPQGPGGYGQPPQGYGYGPPPPPYMAPTPPFQCRACGYAGHAMIVEKISTAGWVVFALLLLVCLPLFWIGLLMKERRMQCAQCRVLIA